MTLMNEMKGRINLKEEARIALTLLRETGEKYGASYLIRLLRGDVRHLSSEEGYSEWTGFGALPDAHPDRLRNIFRFLQRKKFLEVKDEVFGVLMLTDLGHQFLENPQDLWVNYQNLRRKPFEQKLIYDLRRLRKGLCEQKGVSPFQVFTDQMLHNLVKRLPQRVEDLQSIPGFGDYRVNFYGPAILRLMAEAKLTKEQAAQAAMAKKIQGPAYQATKNLFEAGLSEAEIATKREVKPATIRQQLLLLHKAGQINLTPWIEENVAPEVLRKGVDYFKSHEDTRLKAAFESLGLDYATLRLCRLYVSNLTSKQETLATA